MQYQITIRTLAKQGTPKTHIARELGCHRNTVYNVVKREQVIAKQRRHKPSYFEPYKKTIKDLLAKKVTRLRVHEILRQEYAIKKSYFSLCKYIQRHLPKQAKAFGVQVTEPGEVAELDFGYVGLLPNLKGKLVKAWGLHLVLAYSRKGYWTITYDQQIDTLIAGVKDGFEFFDGVPKRLKVDNMKTAILKNQRYNLEFNQAFLEFASHYQTAIVPCAPCHPEHKGKVESGIKYLQTNFIKGRQFASGDDVKKQLYDWMVKTANQRRHGTTKQVPAVVFKRQEKHCLQALPREPFAFFHRGVRKVQTNCHIHFENNYYSVPSCLVGKPVTVRWNDQILRVIYQGEQVALHRLHQGQGDYVTVRSHLPDFKCYSQTEYQARYEDKMREIGKHAHSYFRFILKRKPHYWSRTVRGILGLLDQYGQRAVNLSLKRALYYQVTELVTLRNICHKGLYRHQVEPRLPAQSALTTSQLTQPPGKDHQPSWWGQWVVKLRGESHSVLAHSKTRLLKQHLRNTWCNQKKPDSMRRDLSYYNSLSQA